MLVGEEGETMPDKWWIFKFLFFYLQLITPDTKVCTSMHIFWLHDDGDVISFSFIFVVCNDTKKQNVPTTVVLSTRHQSAEARAQYGVNANVSRGFANNI